MAEFGSDEHNAGYFQLNEYDIGTAEFNINDQNAIYLNPDLGVAGPSDNAANEASLNFLEDFGQAQDFANMANFPNSPIDGFNAPSVPYAQSMQQSQAFIASPTTPTSPNIDSKPTSSAQPLGSRRTSTTEDKRSSSNSSEMIKDDLTVSAEEDKRRRNTAASARFRVKKKQREQAMEKLAKEMSEKVGTLESRIKELEKENCLLKGLLTEKAGRSEGSGDEGVSTRSKKLRTEEER